MHRFPMHRFHCLLITLAAAVCFSTGCTQNPVHPDEREAVAKLSEVRARYKLDDEGHVIELSLLGPAITDEAMPNVTDLSRLENLNLSGAQITNDGLKYVAGLARLEQLNLNSYANPSPVSNAGMKHLAGLAGLETLVLSYTHVGDSGLEHLKDLPVLRKLYLVGARVTDAGLVHLEGLASLETVMAGETGVTAEGLKALSEKNPTLINYTLPGHPELEQPTSVEDETKENNATEE